MAKKPARTNQSEISSIVKHPIENNRKKTVKITAEKIVSHEDLISRLPDEIITHILSYIPTKTAVATSALSKRWTHLWISVPNLDFGFHCSSFNTSPVKKTLFYNFVDRVLSLNNVLSVRKVHFSCSGADDCEFSRFTAWINSVCSRDAEEIRIELPGSCQVQNFEPSSLFYSVPASFFNQKNLVELNLANVVLKVPPLVYFPRLEKIEFHVVQMPDDDSMKNLLSGCPVLRRLTIDRGIYDNVQTMYCCSSTLKYLNLTLGYCGRDYGYNIVIDAPNLTFLHLMDEVGMNYNVINLPSLVEVNVDVEQCEVGMVSTIGFDERLYELLRKISHVKELVLTSGIMRSFDLVYLESIPMFYKLTKLKIEVSSADSWSILPHLFHCTPNLVTLLLNLDNVHPDCVWYESLEVPPCYSSSIEFVEISGFEDCHEEMVMIHYILITAMVLKKLLIISLGLDLEQETRILKGLANLPRSSSVCQVEYQNL